LGGPFSSKLTMLLVIMLKEAFTERQ
jgi:hypothetical protein